MTRRILPPFIAAPTHANGAKACRVMTATAVHTVSLPEGHFAAIVHDRDDDPEGVIVILDRSEAEPLVALLQNAITDAERLDAGQATLHAAKTGTVQ